MKRCIVFALFFAAFAHATDQVTEGSQQYERAAFLGLAFGDAAGALTETYTPAEIQRVFGRHVSTRDPLPLRRILQIRGAKNYRRLRIPGYVTDDTQQAMALVLTFLQNSSVTTVPNPKTGEDELHWNGLGAFARLLINGSALRAWRGQGSSFEAAVAELKKMATLAEIERQPEQFGRWARLRLKLHRKMNPDAPLFDVRASGTPFDSIGAAMRTGPLGALTMHPEALLEAVVIQSSLVTHADVRAVAMAYAMFKATRLLVERRPIFEIRRELVENTRRVEDKLLAMTDWPKNTRDPHAVSTAMREIFARLPRAKTHEQISALVARYGQPSRPQLNKTYTASSGVATLSGLHALALGLADLVNPNEVIDYAVNFGDDTDTVAAMTGCLLGARRGLHWMDLGALPDRERLERYADAVHSGVPPESTSEYLTAETRLTENERAFQDGLPVDPPSAACVKLLDGVRSSVTELEPTVDLFD